MYYFYQFDHTPPREYDARRYETKVRGLSPTINTLHLHRAEPRPSLARGSGAETYGWLIGRDARRHGRGALQGLRQLARDEAPEARQGVRQLAHHEALDLVRAREETRRTHYDYYAVAGPNRGIRTGSRNPRRAVPPLLPPLPHECRYETPPGSPRRSTTR